MKIVINDCFGGFSLSAKALARWAELQGKKAYFFELSFTCENRPLTLEEAQKNNFLFAAYTVPNPQDYKLDERDADGLFKSANERAEKISLQIRTEDRANPLLVQVVEELKEEANGRFAKLKIVEIPDGIDWVIEEYDGSEYVAETHRTWS